MIHHHLSRGADGRYVLPCCGVHLREPFQFPVHCNCRDVNNRPGLGTLMDHCPFRGEPTGDEVPCGCASTRQPVFVCRLHGPAVRYVCNRSKFAGMMCPRCPVPVETAAGLSSSRG